jgi:HEAT repeat protein
MYTMAPAIGTATAMHERFATAEGDVGAKSAYPQSDPPIWKRRTEGGDLFGRIAADRKLDIKDINLVADLSDYLIDKGKSDFRHRATQDLGWLGHKYGIPALLAVARDTSERLTVRGDCVIALGMIRDKRVVDFMINEFLRDPQFESAALAALVGLVGRPPQLYDTSWAGSVRHPPNDPKQRAVYIDTWRNWWKGIRDEVQLGRGLPYLGM